MSILAPANMTYHDFGFVFRLIAIVADYIRFFGIVFGAQFIHLGIVGCLSITNWQVICRCQRATHIIDNLLDLVFEDIPARGRQRFQHQI